MPLLRRPSTPEEPEPETSRSERKPKSALEVLTGKFEDECYNPDPSLSLSQMYFGNDVDNGDTMKALDNDVFSKELSQNRDMGLSTTNYENGNFRAKKKKATIHTQVVVYDDVTHKTKEYRFPGIKSREEILAKLVDRGYIKKIPAEDPSSNLIIESDKSETEESIEEESESYTEESKQSQSNVKNYSPIVKASEDYIERILDYNNETQQTKVSSPVGSLHSSDCSEIRLKSSNSHSLSCIPPSQDLPIDDDNNNDTAEQVVLKVESYCENSVLISPHKSVSAVALVNQDSVERNSKFLTLHHRVSPYGQRQTETLVKPRPKSFFERFRSWIVSLFQSCRRTNKTSPQRMVDI